MDKIKDLFFEMCEYEKGCAERIQHFTKVFEYSRVIGLSEGLDVHTMEVLGAAALVHDIGIKPSYEKYGDCHGPHQEELGPPVAKEMLERLGWAAADIDRICWLVGHHHTYTNIDSADYQILVEADFLVNIYESEKYARGKEETFRHIFKTESGRRLFLCMFE